jgi:hypothetical protein
VAVYKFSNAGGFGTYQRYNDFLAGNTAVIQDTGAMFPLGEFTLAANQAEIDFTNIPQTYTHLQLRIFTKGSASSGVAYVLMRFNSDSGNNYARHLIEGSGSGTPSASAGSSQTSLYAGLQPRSDQTGWVGSIIDILDYRNTSKNRTIRTLTGNDNNGSGYASIQSGLWINTTNAISSIKIISDTSAVSFATNSSFALYGVLA